MRSLPWMRIAARLVLIGALLATNFGAGAASLLAAPDAPPIAVPDDRLDQPIGVPVAIDVTANDIDTDNDIDPATVRLVNPQNLTQTVTRVVVPNEGVWQVNTSNGRVTFSPCTAAGQPDSSCTGLLRDDPFPIEYKVKDRTGLESNPAIITITFDPDATSPPVIQDDTASTIQGQAVTINVLANDSDPDGTLDPASVSIFSQPSHGTVQINTNGSITYTPSGDYTGPDQFIYRVCNTDPSPQCGTANVNVTIAPRTNEAPTVVNDNPPSILHNQATLIDVLANDSDPDGALNPASVQVVSQPSHGSTALTTDGSGAIRYTPTTGYSGSDQFRYRVCDNGSPALCGEATVFLTVLPPANQAPTANDDQATTQQNRAVTIPIVSNDRDPEGALDLTSVTVTVNPSHGSVTINPTNGQATYTPATDYTGPDSFRYTVCDQATPALCSNAATVSITVIPPTNQPPVASDDNAVTQQGQAVTIDVLANDRDPEGALDANSLTIKTNPANGTATKSAGNTITYTPNAGFTGGDFFTYEVCDSAASPLCDTARVNITVAERPNQPPTAVDDNELTQEGQAKAINVLANDSDPEGALDPTSVTVTRNPTNGTTQINAATGVITYTPNAGFSGRDTFEYEVCDAADACDRATVTVTVSELPNQAPTAVDDNAATQQGQARIINVLANDSDPEGALDSSSVRVTTGPTNGSTQVNTTTGAITYTPTASFTGQDSFIYEVCDAGGKCDTATVRVTVNAPDNQPPVAVDDNAATLQGQARTINVLNNDSDPEGALDPTSVSVTRAPANGTTQVNPTTGSITYTPAGSFTGGDSFAYEVCDTAGACATATVNVMVSPRPNQKPTAVDDNGSTLQDTAVVVEVLNNDSDPVDDPTDALDPASVQVTVAPGNGQATVAADGTITYAPAAGYVGDDSFEYEVCDTGSPVLCDTATVSITVRAPTTENSIVVVDDTYEGLINQPVSGNVLTNDSDPEGDTLAAATLETPAVSGQVNPFSGDGSFTYTPNADFTGTDTFVYELCDTGTPQACDTATVTITIRRPANLPPTAVDDEEATRVNQSVTVDVVDNDFDEDGTLVASTLAISETAQHGTAVVNSGQIVYTPAADYTGPDSFVYTICDDGDPQACASATVRITVSAAANLPPVAVDDNFLVRPNQSATLDVLNNDDDPDGSLVPATLKILNPPAHGTATPAGGQIAYTPSADYTGPDTFTYEICDDGAEPRCDSATVGLVVSAAANVAPLAVDDAALVRPGQTVRIDVLGNDVDLDGELVASTLRVSGTVTSGSAAVVNGAIEYTADSTFTGEVAFDYEICDNGSPSACATATVRVTVQALSNLPPIAVDDDVATLPNRPVDIAVLANDVDIDGNLVPATLQVTTAPTSGVAAVNNGLISYTPALDVSGLMIFAYQICDDGTPQGCDEATVRVNIIETSEENEAYAFNDAAFVRAGESVSGNVLANDLDPEEDGWQAPTVETEPSQGTVALAGDGTFTYTASLDFTGNDSWTYRVCDLGVPEACSGATVLITVAPPNRAPVAVDDRAVTQANTPVSGNVLLNDSDPDGDPLTVAITPTVAPATGQVTLTAGGQFTYTPAPDTEGEDSFQYRICDPDGLCATATVRISVRAANMANGSPYAADDRAVTYEDEAVIIQVLANDGDLDGALNPATVAVIDGPDRGSASVQADGSIQFTPATGDREAAAFRYRICDDGAPILCTSAGVRVEIVTREANTTYAFDDAVWGRGPTLQANVLTNDLDLEGDTQTVEPTPAVGPSHGQVALSEDGTFVYTPGAGYAGTDQFTYTVCDDGAPQACTMAMVYLHVFPPNLGWDFGDAFGFPTSLAADGPRHAIVEGLSLGDVVDAEADGVPNGGATSDDVTGVDDETIIEVYPLYDGNGRYSLEVPVRNTSAYPAQLVGWIDWNVNFSLDDPGERSQPALSGYTLGAAAAADNTFSTGNVPAGYTGTVTLTWEGFAIPAARSPVKLVRLRLAGNLPGSAGFFTPAGPAITGAATGGAVVDVLAPIATQRVIVSSFTALPAEESNVDFAWTTALETQVAGFNVLVERGSELVPVNGELIPSEVTNSTTPTDYAYTAPVEGDIFYLEVVMLSGETFLYGPARLGVIPPQTSGPQIYLPLVGR